MHTLLNTLYVMTPHAYAHLENATVRIDVEHEKKQQVITEVAQLAEREQWLLARISQKRRRLADGILMRHATDQHSPTNKTTR